jgi:aspartate-semialdehyde dehydrogenase
VVVTAVFDRKVSPAEAREVLANSPGVGVLDDPANLVFPTPLDTTNKDDCLVGRIRENLVLENALDLWVVGDQVRKGAALNAVQIAEVLIANR